MLDCKDSPLFFFGHHDPSRGRNKRLIIACKGAGAELKTWSRVDDGDWRWHSADAVPLPPLNVTDGELAVLSAAHTACCDALREFDYALPPAGEGGKGGAVLTREDLECLLQCWC
ncbi:hypothetical protein JKP88DRAFT_274755 [Tribonema minus]|uniref:Uncharacterized protein n=1 Tax=Tribonema minus TaxID=303371 RepID=A0A835ZKL7_9STRA|nr:hypothetical protein JKP88DRAFT_274755 [Tribonema minus]